MFIFLITIILATAAGVTAFLLIVSGSIEQFRDNLLPEKQFFPIVTEDGEVIDSKESLDVQLDILQDKLVEKKSELVTNKIRVNTAKESMSKLNSTSAEVRKYYMKLQADVAKSEKDCQQLQAQIEDYRIKQIALRSEIKKDEELYASLLDDVGRMQHHTCLAHEDGSKNCYPEEIPLKDNYIVSPGGEEVFAGKNEKHTMECSCENCKFLERIEEEEFGGYEKPQAPGKVNGETVHRKAESVSCPESFNTFIKKIQEPMSQAVQRHAKKPEYSIMKINDNSMRVMYGTDFWTYPEDVKQKKM